MATVIKDIGEIWTRLFDHRPFIQGEITFFLREFEEKRADREVERLFKILEYTTELKQNQLNRTEQLGDCHLPSLKANVDVALSMCERVLQQEESFNSVNILFIKFERKVQFFMHVLQNENNIYIISKRKDKALQKHRTTRKYEWESFINDMSEKCQKVDQTFQEKIDEIKEFYIDLEKKLHIES
ncbi:biogenesis of lysosome-related organelles complex 1 subunit 5 isoform X1 [Prorops nasuta]|uniref:biogenesis of lysosome-related organelles complex 1 subunit 5 isoform X1 n=1 Tax=Prorops nasuta TaxID=863751 RepID=UPI0034CF0181